MCTSFVKRGKEILIGMNFDNNDMKFNLNTKDPKQFVLLVDGSRGRYPSFGINSNGTFINSLMVNSNGKGLYKRASKKVTHTSKLVRDILAGTISADKINTYLNSIEVVNVPDFSVHNMIVERGGNVWVVEPGRRTIYTSAEETPYFVMSNFSLCDFKESGELKGDGADRYKTVTELLDKNSSLDVDTAFQILEAAKQCSGEWTTAFSMVYSQKEHAVYYCSNMEFNHISKYSFLV